MYKRSADFYLFRNFSDSHTTVPHHHSVHFGNDLVTSACWWTTEEWLALHHCATVFKLVVPLLNLWDAHSIVTKDRLNLPNGFHLAIIQFLAKFDAVPLLQTFHHFPAMKNWWEHYKQPQKFMHVHKCSRSAHASVLDSNPSDYRKNKEGQILF